MTHDDHSLITGKLDEIIALLQQMVQPETPPLACGSCGNDDFDSLQPFTDSVGTTRVLCTKCNHRFTPAMELVG